MPGRTHSRPRCPSVTEKVSSALFINNNKGPAFGAYVHVCLLQQIQDYSNNVTLSLFFWVGLKGQQSQPAHGEFDMILRRVSGTGEGHAHGSRPGSVFAVGSCCLCLWSGDLSQGPTLPSHRVGHVTWAWQIREPRLHIHSDWSEGWSSDEQGQSESFPEICGLGTGKRGHDRDWELLTAIFAIAKGDPGRRQSGQHARS